MDRKYIFLAKIKNSDDRDCVFYYDTSSFTFECGHYFSGLKVCGASFCGFLEELKEEVNNNFDNVETILTKSDFEILLSVNDKMKELGCGIEKHSDRYNQGMDIIEEIEVVLVKLYHDDNKKLFDKVITDEKQWCMNNYNLSSDDVEEIFNNYGHGYSCDLGYRDRGIISAIFDDFDDMVYEEKFSFGYNDIPYFDDESFGKDLLENSSYYELPSGKIVYYSY